MERIAFGQMIMFIDMLINIHDYNSRALFLEKKKKIAFGQMTVKFGVFTVLLATRC